MDDTSGGAGLVINVEIPGMVNDPWCGTMVEEQRGRGGEGEWGNGGTMGAEG